MSYPEERSRLLRILREGAILHRSETQTIRSRDGTSAAWMLDTLARTLGFEALSLAGRCLLHHLEGFEGRQIATYGTTGLPLLASCVLQSQGRYEGILVRKERKAHGSSRLVEGRLRPGEPVVVVDDSISSGTTMGAAIEVLEDHGLRVEGGLFLVRFGWYGGFARMRERGLHVDAVYDIYTDFMDHMEGEVHTVANPTGELPDLRWSERAVPDGLHPCAAARLLVDTLLSTGELLREPRRFDTPRDARGGAWVSLRERDDLHIRPARDGLWRFPEEPEESPGRALALAALRTASRLPRGEEGRAVLERCGVAVTFFSALEPCTPGEVDNDRYGLVVRSTERPGIMGGALPRMPGITGDWDQLQHARVRNARLLSFEPFEILRHELDKVVEPGVRWQPSGVAAPDERPWYEDAEGAGRVAHRARELAVAHLAAGQVDALDPLPVPPDLEVVYVTVFLSGRLRGCVGGPVANLEADLAGLVRLALEDERFDGETEQCSEHVAVSCSLLYGGLELGAMSPEEAAPWISPDRHALTVSQGRRVATLLPTAASMLDLRPLGFVREVVDKAGITRAPWAWRRHDCTTWLATGAGAPSALRGALPVAAPPPPTQDYVEGLAELFARYLVRLRQEDGRLFFRYSPFRDMLGDLTDVPRLAHAAWVLRRAGSVLDVPDRDEASDGLLGFLLGLVVRDEAGAPWLEHADGASVCELSFLLLALCEAPVAQTELARELALALWARFDLHGRLATHRDPSQGGDAWLDYLPGQVLLALARAAATGVAEPDAEVLARATSVVRHRFRYKRHQGQVSWLMQAFAAWWAVTRDPSHAALVFEIGDWILEYQQPGGGFLGDLQHDGPGYTTALFLEGLGAALGVAQELGDGPRYGRTLRACEAGFAFLDGLVIQGRDAPVLPNPAWAEGGLRPSSGTSVVRTDFVQHGLSAALELLPHLRGR